MKKRIFCMILSLVAVFSFFGFEATRAWFAAGKDKKQVLAAGDLSYVVTGALSAPDQENNLALPGDIITSDEGIQLTNESNIDSNLRVKILFGLDSASSLTTYTGVDSNYIDVVFTESSKWVRNGTWYQYYPGFVDGESLDNEKMRIEAASGEIPFIDQIQFVGDKMNNDFSGKTVTVKVVIESKQADYVTWSELGAITI